MVDDPSIRVAVGMSLLGRCQRPPGELGTRPLVALPPGGDPHPGRDRGHSGHLARDHLTAATESVQSGV